MNINLEEEDVLIKRVSNGWIVKHISENDSDFMMTHVFSDNKNVSHNLSSHSSLLDVLFYSFNIYFQTKRQGGIVMTLEESGWQKNEEE